MAEAVRRWIAAVGARTAFIEPGSPWENGYIESFNARLRDELLDGEIFYTLKEAQVLIEAWRCHYNTLRPHGSLGYRPPAPETIVTPEGVHALTFNPDQSMGAGHARQQAGIKEMQLWRLNDSVAIRKTCSTPNILVAFCGFAAGVTSTLRRFAPRYATPELFLFLRNDQGL